MKKRVFKMRFETKYLKIKFNLFVKLRILIKKQRFIRYKPQSDIKRTFSVVFIKSDALILRLLL
jgi:hypothetical protein